MLDSFGLRSVPSYCRKECLFQISRKSVQNCVLQSAWDYIKYVLKNTQYIIFVISIGAHFVVLGLDLILVVIAKFSFGNSLIL